MYSKSKKERTKKIIIILLIVFVVCIVAFIFSNSLKGSRDTVSQSKIVASKIQKVVDSDKKISRDIFHGVIRKIAHIAEFSLLGIGLGSTFYAAYLFWGKKYISLPILLGLSVAVCDEFIQSFGSRKSLVSDVLIDFGGILFGFLIILSMSFLINKIRKKRQQ
ncbi:MAG: VanZ family protein [Ruminococcaceae bacterium]|nr:VanZ family protein [Oscillospiraceae bacterium]